VIVGFNCQTNTTALAAAFENFPPIGSFHAGAEAMHADTAADFRLISTLGGHSVTSLKLKNSAF
jgi:hypothetical protein